MKPVAQTVRPNQIILVGMSGSGKSSVGEELASRLELPLIDVDVEIEFRQNRSIGEIFAVEGEDYFRQVEKELTLEALAQDGIISLGGGAVITDEIRAALESKNVVWLGVSVAEATRRVGLTRLRPLLLGDVRERLTKLLGAREHLYAEVARVKVDTDWKSVGEVVDEILRRLGENADS